MTGCGRGEGRWRPAGATRGGCGAAWYGPILIQRSGGSGSTGLRSGPITTAGDVSPERRQPGAVRLRPAGNAGTWRSDVKRFLGSMLGTPERRGRRAGRSGGGRSIAEDRLAARGLADALDRAMEMKLWAHADRLAGSAARLAAAHPRLTDRLARLRLMEGEPETALAMIESCRHGSASLRLLRAACLIEVGRKAEAHADLIAWSRRSTAPLDARLMLALLEWESGDAHAAVQTLLRNLRHLEDPRTLELLVLLARHQERVAQSNQWAKRLRTCGAATADGPDAELLLQSLGMSGAGPEAEATEEQVDTLAMELVLAEAVIPALVEAMRREPRRRTARLLGRAIERALPELSEQSAAYEALANLSVVLDNQQAAGDWARRALEINPASASLASFLKQFPSSSAEVKPDGDRAVLAMIGPEPQRSGATKREEAA